MKQLPPLATTYFSGEEQTSEIVRRSQRVAGGVLPHVALFHTTSLEDIIATLDD
ncbi:hypothetical protein KA478_00385 [Patescibacteria group bacterium]|nr:hypothetical protein [Patescibacteria group bacterium]